MPRKYVRSSVSRAKVLQEVVGLATLQASLQAWLETSSDKSMAATARAWLDMFNSDMAAAVTALAQLVDAGSATAGNIPTEVAELLPAQFQRTMNALEASGDSTNSGPAAAAAAAAAMPRVDSPAVLLPEPPASSLPQLPATPATAAAAAATAGSSTATAVDSSHSVGQKRGRAVAHSSAERKHQSATWEGVQISCIGEGGLPSRVYKHQGKWRAQLRVNGKEWHGRLRENRRDALLDGDLTYIQHRWNGKRILTVHFDPEHEPQIAAAIRKQRRGMLAPAGSAAAASTAAELPSAHGSASKLTAAVAGTEADAASDASSAHGLPGTDEAQSADSEQVQGVLVQRLRSSGDSSPMRVAQLSAGKYQARFSHGEQLYSGQARGELREAMTDSDVLFIRHCWLPAEALHVHTLPKEDTRVHDAIVTRLHDV